MRRRESAMPGDRHTISVVIATLGRETLASCQAAMLPVAPTSTPLPPEFDKLVKPAKTLDIPPADVAANRRAWTDEWLAAMGR